MTSSKTLLDLNTAVHNWWISKRPSHWTEQQHLTHPHAGCQNRQEEAMAQAYAEVVKLKNQLPAGIYEGSASGNQVMVNVPEMGYAFVIITEDYVKGIDCPVSVRVMEKEDGSRAFQVTHGKPLGYVMNRVESSNGRMVAPSGLIFHQDPPDAE